MAIDVERLKLRRLLLKPHEAADLIGCSRAKLYQMLKAGTIPSVALDDGRMLRVPLAALEKLAAVPE